MRVRVLCAAIAPLATQFLIAASTSAAAQQLQPPVVSSFTEQSFKTAVDKNFRVLAGSQDYLTASNMRWWVQSNESDPSVPLPLLRARFSCIDANKDGRITALEYRDFAIAAFRSAGLQGDLTPDKIYKFADALKCVPSP
jgi:hypothetical protein